MVSSVAYIFLSFSAGLPLRLVFEEGCALAEEAKTHRQAGFHFLVHLTLLQMMSNLMGESEDPCVLTGEFMDENSFLKDATASKDEMVISAVYFRVQALAYYMGNFSLAAEAGRKSRSIRKLASIAMTQQWFFEGITATELARTSRKRSHMKVAHRSMRKMKKWAKHSPNNFLNRALLLEAELALLCGNRDTALKKYKQSIHLANDEGFLHDHALACERIGVALRHFGEERNAGEYFLKAVSSYREWGALAKVNQLEKVIESGG
jgi:tetratricopeptide (TPR) repeat protein